MSLDKSGVIGISVLDRGGGGIALNLPRNKCLHSLELQFESVTEFTIKNV